ncbi:MAG: hypothetical protein N3D76_00300 [Geminocystis sp.]|nr:hypothetical protein [Geminocystis sp.]HIK36695.1 hypothetical protein [Geminocystis sp. M7585_C2015_104]
MWIRLLLARLVSEPPFANEEEGFSLLEVLVTILVITGFVLGALQASVLATLFRIQARDRQEAANWIQQDLELVRFHAYYGLTGNSSHCGQYGTRLRDHLVAQNFTGNDTVTIENRTYQISRRYDPANNTLRIEYTVQYAPSHPRFGSGGNNIVSRLTTEVLPHAAINNCQQ